MLSFFENIRPPRGIFFAVVAVMKQWNYAFVKWTGVACAAIILGCEAQHSMASARSFEGDARAEQAEVRGGPRLRRIYFNPYTDSIKTVLNYYVNVEGEFSDGSYLPLDTADIFLRCDRGTLAGNEWIIPKRIDFDKVTFIAEARTNPQLQDTVTIWIQKWKDPRDAPDYKDPEEERSRR